MYVCVCGGGGTFFLLTGCGCYGKMVFMDGRSRKNSNRWVVGVIGNRELFICGVEIEGLWQTNSFKQNLKENNSV